MKHPCAIVLCALMLSACNDGTSETNTATAQRAPSASARTTAVAGSPAPIVDTCGLFTQAELEAMLRTAWSTFITSPPTSRSRCGSDDTSSVSDVDSESISVMENGKVLDQISGTDGPHAWA